jgi:hypothetical protein
VEEVCLARFAQGHAVFVRPHPAPRFRGDEVIRRARSRLGENRYAILRNNCEHFSEWCVQGEARSSQVDGILMLGALVRTIYTSFGLMRGSDQQDARGACEG